MMKLLTGKKQKFQSWDYSPQVPNYQDFWITKCQIKEILQYMQCFFQLVYAGTWGTQRCSWLKHGVTSQKDRGFDSRWRHWNSSLTKSSQLHYGPGVNSASNRNEYLEFFCRGKGNWCIELSTLPASCAECLEIWVIQPPGTRRACPGL